MLDSVQNPLLLLRTVNAYGRPDLLLAPWKSHPVRYITFVPVSEPVGPITRQTCIGYKQRPRHPARRRALTKVKSRPQTGNVIQVYGLPGCDLSLPMIGDN